MFVKIGDVSKATGFKVATIRDWANKGHIPVAFTSLAGTRMFDLQQVLEIMETWKKANRKPRTNFTPTD